MTIEYYKKSEIVAKAKAFLVEATVSETKKFQKTLNGVEFEVFVTKTNNWFNSGAEYMLASVELDFESFGYDLPALLVEAEGIAKEWVAPKEQPQIKIFNE